MRTILESFKSVTGFKGVTRSIAAAATGYGLLFLLAKDWTLESLMLANGPFAKDHAYDWLANGFAVALLTYGASSFAASFTENTKGRIRHLTAQTLSFSAWALFDIYYTTRPKERGYKLAGAWLNNGVTFLVLAGLVHTLNKEIAQENPDARTIKGKTAVMFSAFRQADDGGLCVARP